MSEESQAPGWERGEDEPDPVSLALREVVRATEGANQALAKRLGLGVTDVNALDHLLSHGPLGPVELGERLGLRSASATALVDRLEAAGHVQRRPHPSDRRRVAIVPTEHAAREATAALFPLLDQIDTVARALAPDERAVVADYLERVTAVLRAYAATPPPE